MTDPTTFFDGLCETAARIESRQLSPVELTRALLERIDQVDGRLHSYATVMAESALDAASRAEEEIEAGRYLGPLHGIPVGVKDLCFTRGVPTMGGQAFRRDFRPGFDSTAVAKLAEAGAVLIGKLSLTEGAMRGYHRSFPIPTNPWGDDLWPGSSSSGSGVAVAAGLCFAALGTDTGGSIRCPTMANGIVGLKPTYGLVSRYGVLALAESLDHVGPMGRRVADVAALLEAIAGHDPEDATSLETPPLRISERLGDGIVGARLGCDRGYATDGTEPGLVTAIEAALGKFDALGAEVVEIELPRFGPDQVNAWMKICSREACAAHSSTFPSRADEYGEFFRDFLERGARVTPETYAAQTEVRDDFNRSFREVLSSVDAVVAPPGGAPFRVRPGLLYGGMKDLAVILEHIQFHFTAPADFAGTPTISLPCGQSPHGVPYTIQLLGDQLTEPTLCRIAHTYEQATGWHHLHPEV
ncbi:MAG: amidase [Acidobacteriota bacterium]|nr:amidase [Acidobacteriota bacterium]